MMKRVISLLLFVASAATFASSEKVVFAKEPKQGSMTVVSTLNGMKILAEYDIALRFDSEEPRIDVTGTTKTLNGVKFEVASNGAYKATTATGVLPHSEAVALYMSMSNEVVSHPIFQCLDMAGSLKFSSKWQYKSAISIENYAQNQIAAIEKMGQKPLPDDQQRLMQKTFEYVQNKADAACKSFADSVFGRWFERSFISISEPIFDDALFTSVDSELVKLSKFERKPSKLKLQLLEQSDSEVVLRSRQAQEFMAEAEWKPNDKTGFFGMQRQEVVMTIQRESLLPSSVDITESTYTSGVGGPLSSGGFVASQVEVSFEWAKSL